MRPKSFFYLVKCLKTLIWSCANEWNIIFFQELLKIQSYAAILLRSYQSITPSKVKKENIYWCVFVLVYLRCKEL